MKMLQSIKRRIGWKRERPLSIADIRKLGFPAEIAEAVVRCKPFTMTSIERLASLCEAINYIEANGIPGDVVECGVWQGGSMMAASLSLQSKQSTQRKIYLYDTYEGMSDPTDVDQSFDGLAASDQLAQEDRSDPKSVWCVSGLDQVKQNMSSTGYPESQLEFVKGKVEETIPAIIPEQIALLRLDTDWYESTRHELEHLFPRISPGGVLIIDDYGHWKGARQAVDEYLSKPGKALLLHRIDYTGRIAIVPQLDRRAA